MLQLQKTISGQTTKEEQMKAAIRESQTKHQQQVLVSTNKHCQVIIVKYVFPKINVSL